MGKLLVFYSLEGNTEYIADRICEKIGCDKLRLIPKKAYKDKGFAKFLWGGKSAVMAETPELESYDVDLDKVDELIIGFPVWASTITPPIRTFLTDNKDALKEKKIAVYACQAGNGAPKAMDKIRDLLGIDDFMAKAVFIDPKTRPSDENEKVLEEFTDKL
ncbi:Flavodoxin [Oscillospiraceae bacterium]|nr:Flavodoxin [Oscillospiraceae bacterium]